MLTAEECIGKVVLIRDRERYGYTNGHTTRYEEAKFLELSPSRTYVKVQWQNARIDWLSINDFDSMSARYRIEEVLRDINVISKEE